MYVSDVHVKLVTRPGEKLLGFADIVLDHEFAVADIKIIAGLRGIFIAMPTRKLAQRCPCCGRKNDVESAYCCHCGKPQRNSPNYGNESGRAKFFTDIAHPIRPQCRQNIEEAILKEYNARLALAREHGDAPQALAGVSSGGVLEDATYAA